MRGALLQEMDAQRLCTRRLVRAPDRIDVPISIAIDASGVHSDRNACQRCRGVEEVKLCLIERAPSHRGGRRRRGCAGRGCRTLGR